MLVGVRGVLLIFTCGHYLNVGDGTVRIEGYHSGACALFFPRPRGYTVCSLSHWRPRCVRRGILTVNTLADQRVAWRTFTEASTVLLQTLALLAMASILGRATIGFIEGILAFLATGHIMASDTTAVFPTIIAGGEAYTVLLDTSTPATSARSYRTHTRYLE